MKRLKTIYMKDEVHKKLKHLANSDRRTIGDMIEILIDMMIKNQVKK